MLPQPQVLMDESRHTVIAAAFTFLDKTWTVLDADFEADFADLKVSVRQWACQCVPAHRKG